MMQFSVDLISDVENLMRRTKIKVVKTYPTASDFKTFVHSTPKLHFYGGGDKKAFTHTRKANFFIPKI